MNHNTEQQSAREGAERREQKPVGRVVLIRDGVLVQPPRRRRRPLAGGERPLSA
jgi:hypothetical protein